MKQYILPLIVLLFAPCSLFQMRAQSYFVSSLATPDAATFSADKIDNNVITLPFTAATHTIQIETNQVNPLVSCDASWCQASFAEGTLTLTVTENTSEDTRTAFLTVRSKDFHPLLITVKQEARLVFAVISDIHVGNNYGEGYKVKIPQALQHLTGHGKLDALAVVGDLTDNGKTEEYKELVQFFGSEQNILNPVDKFLFMMGNHDNYNDNGQTNYRTGLKAFNNNRVYPFHQYVLIKGYPFITISDLGRFNDDISNPNNGTISYPTSSVKQLENYLEKAVEDAPGKPIFVFTHVPPRWTCYSTWVEYENAAWAMKVLNPVLNKYPQVVLFGGHSHYPLGDPRSIHQGANPNSSRNNFYTVINTASTTYSEINPGAVDVGIHPEKFEYVTEGMILVELPKGDIEIRRYDTYRNVEIDPQHRWVLKAPFDGSQFQYADIRDADDNPNNITLRTGLPAPAFEDGAELTLKASEDYIQVTFPQATDNECVFRYNIRVLENGNVVKSAFIFSQFYLSSAMPLQLSHTIEGLEANTNYEVQVIAYDSYDNQSTALTGTVTTLSDNRPMPEPIGIWTFDNVDNLMEGTGAGNATLQSAIIETGSLNVVDNPASAYITPVAGPKEGNGAITIPVASGLMMTSNLTEQSLSTYSFMFDIRSEELSGYTAIYQNDITNQKDGSFFIKNGQLGLATNGLNYNGQLFSGNWHRVVFVVKNNIPTIYLDGTQIGKAASASDYSWQMGTGALFFIDNDGEEHRIETSEIRFWDEALNSKHVHELGKVPTIGDPIDVEIPEPLGIWTFDNPNNLMEGIGTATLIATIHSTDGSGGVQVPAEGNGITPVDGPKESNGAVNVPIGSSMYMAANLDVTDINTYSILWDVKASDFNPYTPLLQNDINNKKDGSLFIYKNKVGLGGRHGLGYNGNIDNDKWYRILFVVENGYGTIYVDGEIVGQSIEPCEEHWKLPNGAIFFADNDGEETEIQTAEIRFWNEALDVAQAAKLGDASNNTESNSDPNKVPEALCYWTFDSSSNPLTFSGGTGTGSLQPYKKTSDNNMVIAANLSEANISVVDGPTEENGAIAVPVNSSLYMAPNVQNISTYSFLLDVKLDNTDGFAALFNNQITNQKDASLFIKDGMIGLNNAGLAYNGTINAGQWHRIVFVVKNNYGTVYVDGQKVAKSIQPLEEHWYMASGLVFFADQDGEEKDIVTSEIRFWDKDLTDKQVFLLGTVGNGEAQETTVPEVTGAWNFDNANDLYAGTGTASLIGWKKGGTGISISGPLEELAAINGPSESNGAITVPAGYALQMSTNLEAENLDSYTWLMDISLENVSGYAALFQNDETNQKDGSLFVKDGGVGVNTSGLKYHGNVNAKQWHRIIFVVNHNWGTVYVDGVKVGQSTSANELHWLMGKKALFFADNDGEEKDIKTAEIRFWDKAFTEGQVEMIGVIPTE